MIRFTFLSENKTYRKGFYAEAGLSIHIEAADKKILFDTGASASFARNAKLSGVDLSQVDFAVISHGHYDHTGGVPEFCIENKTAPIYIHEKAFETTYAMHGGKIAKVPCSILWSEEERKALEPRLKYTRDVIMPEKDIFISGTIPAISGFTPTDKFYVKKDGEYLLDEMEHEQFLAVRDRDEEGRSKGIYVFSGCSHKGVVAVLRYVHQLFPKEHIKGLIAGMHLCNATEEMRSKVISEVEREDIQLIMPVHCTGILAIAEMKQRLGSKCVIANTGDRYED